MAKRVQKAPETNQVLAPSRPAQSLKYAQKGIKTSHDFANFMSGLMSDLIEGRVTPGVGNAACNAGGKLLKVIEMQYRYGTSGKDGKPKTLELTVVEKDGNEG